MADKPADPATFPPTGEPIASWPVDQENLRPSDYNTALVHLYRAEVSRSNIWRQRLDTTTNWAVVTTAAALSLAFSSAANEHALIIIDTMLVLLFLFIEARRYRYYELFSYRVRLMENSFFGAMLISPFYPSSESAQNLLEHLRAPFFNISLLEALGRRYRRNYAPIFLILALAWAFKVLIHPLPATNFQGYIRQASIGPLAGFWVVVVVIIFNIILIAIGLFTVGLRESSGEVFRAGEVQGLSGWLRKVGSRFRQAAWEAFEIDTPVIRVPGFKPRKELVFVISDKSEAIGQALMTDLARGVTRLSGTGMFTGHEHDVLMCALTAEQISRLNQIISEKDPQAFVMVTPLQDVRGSGFRPLEA